MATIKELQSQIDKLDVSLKKISTTASKVQAEMNSGDWGTSQLTRFQAQLDSLNAKLSAKQGKRANLVDQQATRDFEILSKAINTVTRNLESWNAQKASMSKSTFGAQSDDFKAVEASIKNAETALSSFQSRMFKNYNAQGYRKTAADRAPFGAVDLEGRLGPLPASARLESVVNKVPGGAGTVDAEAKAAQEAFRNAFKSVKKTAAELKAESDALAEAQRLAYIKAQANAKEMAFARSHGFDPTTDYKGSTGFAGGAYRTSQYARKDEMGGLYKENIRIDKSGNASTGFIPKANQSFAQGITKDIGDLLKWSVAIAAIYGPINAVSEAMKQLIVNEAALADVSIALNSELVTTNQIFDDTYAAARRSGEGVSGIIGAFGAAYTAAGRIQDPLQRYAATLTLLDDSLVLSKLSTLDQAGAIDVLTAALYQTGDANASAAEKLSRGRDLIDQWIAVSKIASVSVETLATGVAVLGDSAETAGMTLEQMNAMIATLSEVSLSSGKETANIAKALIGNYQQESAVKELNRLGIAVTDTSGKTRQFLDVMKEVAALRSTGLLGDQDFSRLTLALGGGGIRRQKDVAAYIENFARAEQIAGMQGGASGASEEAMAKKLDTVQTASTNLTSSLTNLAQTMGTEGGLLDMFSLSIKGATGFISVLNGIASAVGKVGPLLLGLGVGSIIMKGSGVRGMGGLADSMITNLGMNRNLAGSLTGQLNPVEAFFGRGGGRGMGGSFGGSALGRGAANMTTLPSMAAIALPAMQNLSQGDTTEAGANIAGGIAGALVGGPVGALVGSAIAEAFVRTTMTYDKQFADFFAGAVKTPEEEKAKGTEKSQAEMTKEAFKAIGGGSELWGSLKVFGQFAKETLITSVKGAGTARRSGEADMGDFSKYLEGYGSIFSGKSTQTGGPSTRLASALEMLKEADPEMYNRIRMSGAVAGMTGEETTTKLTARQEALSTPQNQNNLMVMQRQRQEELRGQMISGEIKPADYQNRMSSLSAYTTTANRWLAAMEQGVGGVGSAFSTTEEAYAAFLEIMASGNQESINNINSQIATIVELQNIVDEWDPKEKTVNMNINGITQDWTKQGIQEIINQAPSDISTSASQAAQQARLQNLDIRTPVNGMAQPMSRTDADMIAQEAYKLDKIQYANLKKEDFKALKESWDEVAVAMIDGGNEFVDVIKVGGENISKENFNAAKQKLEDEGKIKTDTGGVDWQVGSATKAQYLDAEARAPAFTKMLESKGYKSDVTDTIVTTSDKQTIVSHGDQKVVQYLLQQILDTEKKQLQGIYNLPEGANIYVPFQGYELGMGTNTGTEAPLTDVNGDNKVAQANPVLNTEDLAMRGKGYNRDNSDIVASILEKEDKINSINEMRGRGYNRNNLDTSTAGGSTTPKDTGILEQLINVLRGLFPAAGQPITGGRYSPMDAMKNAKPLGAVGQQAATPPINNRLDLKLTSTTNLLVDGRVLASIVKPYLAADLMRTNESGGTVTRSFVI